jgi:hypothetical protein
MSFTAPTYDELSKILHSELGIDVRPYSTQNFGRTKYKHAISMLIPQDNLNKTLDQVRKVLPAGVLAFIGATRNLSNEHVNGVELVVIISNDQLDILRAAGSDGVNFGLTTEEIIAKLKVWDQNYGIDIWQAETDTIQLTFKNLPTDLDAFSREVYTFCPDIVDQGSGNINEIGDYLKQSNAICLWWD